MMRGGVNEKYGDEAAASSSTSGGANGKGGLCEEVGVSSIPCMDRAVGKNEAPRVLG